METIREKIVKAQEQIAKGELKPSFLAMHPIHFKQLTIEMTEHLKGQIMVDPKFKLPKDAMGAAMGIPVKSTNGPQIYLVWEVA